MFEFDAGKLVIIGIVALIVIGPKELPRVMRQVGLAVGKMRKLAGEFQAQFMDAMREADVADIKAEAEKLSQQAKIDLPFDPVAKVKSQISGALMGPIHAPHEASSEPGGESSLDAANRTLAAELIEPVPDAATDPAQAPVQSASDAISPGMQSTSESPAPDGHEAVPSQASPIIGAGATLPNDTHPEQPPAAKNDDAAAAPEPLPLRTSA